MTLPGSWSVAEDDIVRRAYADGVKDELIVRILAAAGSNRTISAVETRRRKLKLTKTYRGVARRTVSSSLEITKDADPLPVLGERQNKTAHEEYVRACVREARRAGATIAEPVDLIRYVRRFELDIPRGVPRDIPVVREERSYVGSQFADLPVVRS
jgi:hypothetical protein